jgi:ATP-dependent Clp protease adapter protein ClpS
MSFKVDKLKQFEVILRNDDDCAYSDITKALKLIFNLSENDAGCMAIEANTGAEVVIETIHCEKKELRESQIRTWNEKGESKLPIIFKEVK